MNTFNITGLPKLIFGTGKVDELPNFIEKYGTNVLLITGGSSLKKSGNFDKIKDSLNKFTVCYAAVKGEPSPAVIDSIVKKNIENSIDVVCAIGGGSVLDTGKAVSAMLKEENYKTVKDYLEGIGTKEPSGAKIPFIALPTTSGTGSEATKNAVITEMPQEVRARSVVKKNNRAAASFSSLNVGDKGFKKSLRHDNYIPDIAIIDPNLMLNCPASVTAASGLDALSQLLESFLSTKANAFTDALAIDAMHRMLRTLVPVCGENSEDVVFREEVAYGAFASGITLAHAGLGTVHGLAGVIGGYKNIPHGLICGLLLPHWLEETVNVMLDDIDKYRYSLFKLGSFAKYYAVGEDRISRIVNKFVLHIKNMSVELKLPKLRTYGVTEKDLKLFAKEGGNKNNPVLLTFEQKLNILKKAF